MHASGVRGAPRVALALVVLAALGVAGAPRVRATATARAPALPAIVFVSRLPPEGVEAGQVPGLGPHGTFAGSGGRLMERAPDGRVRGLLPPGRLHDVADPAVSEDGREVAFAGRERPGGPWRIWSVPRAYPPSATASEPRCRTCDGDPAAGDDADPAWWGDTLLHVSTRAGGRSLYDGSPATQLWALLPDGRRVHLTSEPNGVLDPVADRAAGRVFIARWWFNPFGMVPSGGASRGERAPGDTVNVWQVVSARLASARSAGLALEDVRLAAGGTLPRRSGMGLQPALLAAGGVLAVAARNTGLAPRPGALAIHAFGPPPGRGVRVSGAAIGDEAGEAYREGANLAAPAACAPAALGDGRFLCALDPGGRGEFGLCLVSRDGAAHEMLVDEPGRWELDPAVVPAGAPAARGGTGSAQASQRQAGAGSPAPRHDRARAPLAAVPTFRYLARDLYAGSGAPARRDDAVLHVFRLDGEDSARAVGRSNVPRSGRVDLMLPADVPLFEVLTDRSGRVLTNARGIAQVRGFNAGAPGAVSRCAGCHLGHSARRP